MMSREEFMNELAARAMVKVPDQVTVQVGKVLKAGDIEKMQLSFVEEGKRVAPSIHTDYLFDAYERGELTVEGAVEELLVRYEDSMKEAEIVEASVGTNEISYEGVKERLGFRVVEIARNTEWLKEKPYVPIGNGMARVFLIHTPVGRDESFHGSISVNDDIFFGWGKSLKEVDQAAVANQERLEPATLESMEQKLMGLLGGDDMMEDLLKDIDVHREIKEILVLSNQSTTLGASVMCYPNLLEKISEKINQSFYLLPSSQHELLVVPVEIVDDPKDLCAMVVEVNASTVSPEDLLSDNVMFFDGEQKVLSMPFCEVPQKPQIPLSFLSDDLKRLLQENKEGLGRVEEGSLPYGKIDSLKRECDYLGISKYVDFNQRGSDVSFKEGLADQFDFVGNDLKRYEKNEPQKAVQKDIAAPRL